MLNRVLKLVNRHLEQMELQGDELDDRQALSLKRYADLAMAVERFELGKLNGFSEAELKELLNESSETAEDQGL